MTDLRPDASGIVDQYSRVAVQVHRRVMVVSLLTLVTLFSAIIPNNASAQTETNFNAANTSSPRDTLKSFIDACNEIYRLGLETKYFDRFNPEHMAIIDRAVDCIDQTDLPAFTREERAAEIAVCLKEILDRSEMPPWDEIPGPEDVKATDSGEELTHYRIPNTRITIAKVEQGDRRHEYLFSPGTADRALRYFKKIETKPCRTDPPEVSQGFYRWFVSAPGHPVLAATIDGLPEFFKQQIWGVATWKWLGLIVMLVVGLAGIWMTYRAHVTYTDRVREKSLFLYWLTLFFPIIAILIPLVFKYVAYRYLSLRSTPLYIIDFISIFIALVAGLVIIFATSNRVAATVIASPQINPAGLHAQLIRILFKIASLAASLVLLLYGGQYLGIPVGTLLASAGIGGVAIALGAQDSLKSLFGTLNLLANKQFRVGERIVFKSYDGVVEDVGLQTCRLRLFNGSQLSIPNDLLAGSDIENVGRRKHIRRIGLIHIPLDSKAEKVQQAVTIIREELADHEGMTVEHPPRVYFDDISSEAYTIKFYYWYSPPEFWKFKEFSDKLNFAIFRRFEAQGIEFSLPSRHSFWKHDREQGPLDVNLIDNESP